MTHRVIQRIVEVLRATEGEPMPHFHQGPQSAPAACHDPRCTAPRLDL